MMENKVVLSIALTLLIIPLPVFSNSSFTTGETNTNITFDNEQYTDYWYYSTIDNNPYLDEKPSTCLDDSGRIHVCYTLRTQDNDRILKYAVKSGSSWASSTVYDYGKIKGSPVLCLDEAKVPHILFTGIPDKSYPNDYRLIYATYNNGHWDLSIVDSIAYPDCYDMKVDGEGHVHICFTQYHHGLFYGRLTSNGWSTLLVDRDTNLDDDCALATDKLEHVHILYSDTMNYQTKYATNVNGGWSVSVVNDDWPQYISMAFDSNNTLQASYHTHGPSHSDRLNYLTNRNGEMKATILDDVSISYGEEEVVASCVGPNGAVLFAYNRPGTANASDGLTFGSLFEGIYQGQVLYSHEDYQWPSTPCSIVISPDFEVSIVFYDEKQQSIICASNKLTVCEAPIGVHAAVDEEGISITWQSPYVNGGYKPFYHQIMRSDDGHNFSVIATVNGSASSYIDSSCNINSTYYYKIIAINPVGPGEESEMAKIKMTALEKDSSLLSSPSLVGILLAIIASSILIVYVIHAKGKKGRG